MNTFKGCYCLSPSSWPLGRGTHLLMVTVNVLSEAEHRAFPNIKNWKKNRIQPHSCIIWLPSPHLILTTSDLVFIFQILTFCTSWIVFALILIFYKLHLNIFILITEFWGTPYILCPSWVAHSSHSSPGLGDLNSGPAQGISMCPGTL